MQTDALRELPDMSNENRTRKTTCDICLYLRKFLCSEVNILKSGNTIPNSIYFCILFCDRGSGKCCCVSKIHFFLDARYVVCSVLSCNWTCFGAMSESLMVRAFASEAGGAGSNPGRVIPKTLKMVPVATLLGAQH